MSTALVWFRRDLRLDDNPALRAAAARSRRLVPVFIYAPDEEAPWEPGAASRWWLHHSLAALDASLADAGSRLVLRTGPSLGALRALAQQTGAGHVFWNRLYEPACVQRDTAIKEALQADGIAVESSNGALLDEPWENTRDGGEPYRVFTPFWRARLRDGLQRATVAAPRALPPLPDGVDSTPLDALGLLPTIPWDEGLAQAWRPGERGAREALERFLDEAVVRYPSDRDHPGLAGTSRLSPHLHFGEISPRRIVASTEAAAGRTAKEGLIAGTESFIREVGWREFAYHLIFHFPRTAEEPLDRRFDGFRWTADHAADLEAWQRGRTGIPVVDAGMRELWHTGWMHNRIRMVVASLLTKNLLVPWQTGARWFWDTLVDADLASNTLGWQWTAGCGADAAPYFRIFNPVLQGRKFDPDGTYVRRWVPELAALPDGVLHQPWASREPVLADAGVVLGRTYPLPVVDLKGSRARALERFDEIKRRADPPRGAGKSVGRGTQDG